MISQLYNFVIFFPKLLLDFPIQLFRVFLVRSKCPFSDQYYFLELFLLLLESRCCRTSLVYQKQHWSPKRDRGIFIFFTWKFSYLHFNTIFLLKPGFVKIL